MEVAWRKSSRRILNIDRRSHNVLIPHLMCTHDLRIMIEQRIFNFYVNCLNHKNKLISNIFKNSLVSSISYFKRNLNIILDKHKIKFERVFDEAFKVELKGPSLNNEWKVNFIKHILKDRDFNNYEFLSKDELNIILKYLCTS